MVYTSASDNGSGFLGVDADGRLWAWGDNASGQFGKSSTEPSSVPVLVNLDTTEGIAAIATSGESCMVVLGSGEVLTWGENLNGELGLGFFDAADLPVQISGLEDIERVAGGGSSFARSLAGDWFQWGQHDWRSILRPEAFQSLPTMPGNPPIEIKSVSREVHYGFPFSVGRMADGTLRAWGYPGDVDLGVQDTAIFGNPTAVAGHPGLDASQAAQVLGVTQAIDHAVSPGRFRTFDDPFELDHHLFCLAVVFSGNVQAWGDNQYGQLGDGTTIDRSTAITVSGLTGASKVAAGGSHSLALKTNGTVWAWGDNSFGQLGDGTHTQRTTPVQVTGLTGVIGIAAGYRSSIALKADGTVWVWGGADDSVLSPLGLSADRTTPIQVPGVAQITQIALALGSEPSDASFFGETDQQTALCLATSGRVWTWSWDERVVGRFDGDDPTIPAPVEGLADVSSICGGLHCAFAVKTDGSVWTWGSNNYGAMGTSSNVVTTPSHVVGFGGASQTLSTLGTGSELDSWFLDYFSASELLSANYIADESDPDGDGIPNLMEYALGLDPRRQSVSRWIQVNGVWQNESLLPTTRVDLVAPTAQSEGAYVSQLALFSLPTVDMTSGKRYLAFTVNRNGGIRQDIDYIVEVSSDLATWRSGDPHTIKVLDTAEVLEVYSATALEDAPRQFMRLRVQRREGFFCP